MEEKRHLILVFGHSGKKVLTIVSDSNVDARKLAEIIGKHV
ncbi:MULTISPECIES: hypothetical protein [Brevibacillus]|nr:MULTISPECIES: hypothetical protein [Brevibacillus]